MSEEEYETGFLNDLVLLRNDPELIFRVLPLAEAGNPHAQYAMGLIYAEGRGVEQDSIKAYVWLSRAARSGDQEAILLRDMLMNQMSREEIALAQRELSKQAIQ
ncbi:MAG: sel1 repeat family protein [Gammaproteobacteria bacterium]|nr:sel1 repeat family protein [Gammaproteobacteria bacterium]